jgi:hypothetical protein
MVVPTKVLPVWEKRNDVLEKPAVSLHPQNISKPSAFFRNVSKFLAGYMESHLFDYDGN